MNKLLLYPGFKALGLVKWNSVTIAVNLADPGAIGEALKHFAGSV